MADRDVWEIVDKPRHSGKLVDWTWVFKRKLEANGKYRYKARLCVRGCLDRNCYHVNEVYSPTASLATFRLVIALAAEFGWNVQHLDVTAAFLYGELTKDVIVTVPKGYHKVADWIDPNHHALKLKKSVYGLKVASKGWHVKISRILREAGLRC